MRLDPEGSYFMPVSFRQRPIEAGVFEEVWTLSTSYHSDRNALAALLPEPYEPADEPLVTVHYSQCRKVQFLAGGGYNLMGVDLAAFFNGRKDQLQGNYSLVMWENQPNPVIRGRELLGVPKLLAEVPDPVRKGGDWRVSARENDRVLLQMEIQTTQEQDPNSLTRLNAEDAAQPLLGWRYIPNVDGVGAALSHATLVGRERCFQRAWSGEGLVRYGDLTWERNPASADIIEALKTLVVREYTGSWITLGSMTITRALNRVLR